MMPQLSSSSSSSSHEFIICIVNLKLLDTDFWPAMKPGSHVGISIRIVRGAYDQCELIIGVGIGSRRANQNQKDQKVFFLTIPILISIHTRS